MPTKLIRFFHYSTAGLLLAVAVALFIGSRVDAPIVLPHDPVFAMSTHNLFWILGGICLGAALIALCGEPTLLRALVIVCLVTVLAGYRLVFLMHGGRMLGGYLGSFSDAFGVTATTAGMMAEVTLAWLVLGSYLMLPALWWQKRRDAADTGIIPKPEYLKMSCYFCEEHIEFPAHALGEKISCPHCKKDITLKEPA